MKSQTPSQCSITTRARPAHTDLSHHHKSRQSQITSSHLFTPHLTSHLSPHISTSHRLAPSTPLHHSRPHHRSLPGPRSLIALDRSLPSTAHCPRPCLCLLLGCPRRSSDPCQSARVEKLPHTPTQGLCYSHWASSAITKRQHKRGEGAGKKERRVIESWRVRAARAALTCCPRPSRDGRHPHPPRPPQ